MSIWKNKSGKIFNSKISKSIDIFLEKMITIYPRRYIVYLNRDYPSHSDTSRKLVKEGRYINRFDFFDDYGFTYVDINKVDIDKLNPRSDLFLTIKECNERRELLKKNSLTIQRNGVSKEPIHNYYHDGHWYPDLNKLNIYLSDKDQIIVDKFFNKLLNLYPNRIVYKFQTLYSKFYENYYHKVRKILLDDKQGDIFEPFGFEYVLISEKCEVQEEVVEFEKVFYNGEWKAISGKMIPSNLILSVNYICSLFLAYFPDRKIRKSAIFNIVSIKKFNKVVKPMNYDSAEYFLRDFGFVFLNGGFIKITTPEYVYSPDGKYLFKVNSLDKKIFINEKTEYIMENSFSALPVEVIDLSYIKKNQLTIKAAAFEYCNRLDYIINVKSIKRIEKGAFLKCNSNSNSILFEELNEIFDNCYNMINKYTMFDEKNDEVFDVFCSKKINLFSNVKVNGNRECSVINMAIPFIREYESLEGNLIEVKNNYSFNAIQYDRDVIQTNEIFSQKNEKITRLYLSYIDENFRNEEIKREINRINEKYEFKSRESFDIEILKEDGETVDYVKNSKDFIDNRIKNLIDSEKCVYYRYLAEWIAHIHTGGKFIENIDCILNGTYIKSFLKFHELTPYAFLNSDILMGNKEFILKLFQLFPFIDVSIIDKRFLRDTEFVTKIKEFSQSNYMKIKLDRIVKEN